MAQFLFARVQGGTEFLISYLPEIILKFMLDHAFLFVGYADLIAKQICLASYASLLDYHVNQNPQ